MNKELVAENVYIWTEALGCAEILRPMLLSFTKHHDEKIYVYIYENELDKLPAHENILPILIKSDSNEKYSKDYFIDGYKKGHLGTARLWAHIIKSINAKYLIHLDSDCIFLGNVLKDLSIIQTGYGVVGSRRPYRHFKTKSFSKRLLYFFMPDAVNTHCFAFQNDLQIFSREELIKIILGQERSALQKILFPNIDFFDQLTFKIRKTAGIYYLDSVKQNKSGRYSRYGVFEKKMISFSGVGSGYAFYHGLAQSTSKSYEEFAISSYSLYSKYLLAREIDVDPLESKYLIDLLAKLDQTNWEIKS